MTLKEVGDVLAHVVKHMAAKEDFADMKHTMPTKEQVIALHTQVNSIETQLRAPKYVMHPHPICQRST